MSQEFQIAFPCPHETFEEPVALDDDGVSLYLSQPIAASQSVFVEAVSFSPVRALDSRDVLNIESEQSFYIPPSGLKSVAQIKGRVSGPFNVDRCAADLTLIGSAEQATFTIPYGVQVDAQDIVNLLTPQLNTILAENIDGHLLFSDMATVGQDSRIFVKGTAASTLGFDLQYGARGAVVFPSWRLAKRSDLDISWRFPQFTEPVAQEASYKVTYTSPVERCLRCRATFVENDWRFDLEGDPVRIENEDLLYQAAFKILLTTKGSNPFHPFYGSQIRSRIGAKIVGAVTTLLNEDVRLALRNMQQLQVAQAKYQKVTPKERLYALLSVNVTPHESDSTAFYIDLVVTNASGEPVSLSIVFTVPGVAALQGTNGLSLGLETTGLTASQVYQL